MGHCLFRKASLSTPCHRAFLFGVRIFESHIYFDVPTCMRLLFLDWGPERDVVCLVFGACTRTGPWPVVMGARTFNGGVPSHRSFASVLSDRLLLRALCVDVGRFTVGSCEWPWRQWPSLDDSIALAGRQCD